LLVRTWNLFHGNTFPPGRTAPLEEMLRLVVEDGPDVVCLQEVPAWAVEELATWSGMRTFSALGMPPRIGPLPSLARVGRRLTALHPGFFRSAFNGQANAILARPELRPAEAGSIVLNSRAFRSAQTAWLELGVVERLAWAREPRVCHAVWLSLPDGRRTLVATLHATAYAPDKRLADAELLRAATFADGLAGPSDPVVLAGDFNVTRRSSRTLRQLVRPEWGFSRPASGIDHVLARGLRVAEGPTRWDPERRAHDGRLLSDHAPVEAKLE
jgi:endonuclease/exonuclease/phosphatase family metal-dependent hydrolase